MPNIKNIQAIETVLAESTKFQPNERHDSTNTRAVSKSKHRCFRRQTTYSPSQTSNSSFRFIITFDYHHSYTNPPLDE